MLSLTKNLFRELNSLHRAMDELFEQNFRDFNLALPEARTLLPRWSSGIESYTKDNNLVYRMELPGIDPKNIDLSVIDNQVTIKAQRSIPEDVKEDDWVNRSFSYGTFEYSFTLPEGAEADKLDASLANGMLELTVPAGKAVLPRKIEVRQIASGSDKQLKAKA